MEFSWYQGMRFYKWYRSIRCIFSHLLLEMDLNWNPRAKQTWLKSELGSAFEFCKRPYFFLNGQVFFMQRFPQTEGKSSSELSRKDYCSLVSFLARMNRGGPELEPLTQYPTWIFERNMEFFRLMEMTLLLGICLTVDQKQEVACFPDLFRCVP